MPSRKPREKKTDYRTAERRNSDREAIAELLVRGERLHSIANYLGLPLSIVERDVAIIKEGWARRRAKDYDAWYSKELLYLDVLAREAWQYWEASKQGTERIVSEKTGREGEDSFKIQRTTERTPGDVRAIKALLEIQLQRLEVHKIYGEVSGKATTAATIELSPDQVATIQGLLSDEENLNILEYMNVAGDEVP